MLWWNEGSFTFCAVNICVLYICFVQCNLTNILTHVTIGRVVGCDDENKLSLFLLIWPQIHPLIPRPQFDLLRSWAILHSCKSWEGDHNRVKRKGFVYLRAQFLFSKLFLQSYIRVQKGREIVSPIASLATARGDSLNPSNLTKSDQNERSSTKLRRSSCLAAEPSSLQTPFLSLLNSRICGDNKWLCVCSLHRVTTYPDCILELLRLLPETVQVVHGADVGVLVPGLTPLVPASAVLTSPAAG